MHAVFIIAEAGVNHNGSTDLALRLVEKAKETGADAIKFQTISSPEANISKWAPKAAYQDANLPDSKTQLEMVKGFFLSFREFEKICTFCRNSGIIFMSSPFDPESARFLAGLGLEIFKIPSGEITNILLLREIGHFNKKVILSTGMSTIHEIMDAIDLLEESGTQRRKISLLHCTTEYPAPFNEVNLNAIVTLKKEFGLEVGYSDHTLGIEISLAAVSMGATIIEKHFTLDRSMKGPDHKSSLEPNEFRNLVTAIRHIESAMGDGIKKPSVLEIKNIAVTRKSIVAGKKINKGEEFTEENITVKRPGTGLSPMIWDQVIGKKAKRDFLEDELIEI
jgi:N,N'-diacetyllegionaminate synthase